MNKSIKIMFLKKICQLLLQYVDNRRIKCPQSRGLEDTLSRFAGPQLRLRPNNTMPKCPPNHSIPDYHLANPRLNFYLPPVSASCDVFSVDFIGLEKEKK